MMDTYQVAYVCPIHGTQAYNMGTDATQADADAALELTCLDNNRGKNPTCGQPLHAYLNWVRR